MKRLICLLFIILTLPFLIQQVEATTSNFIVPGGEEVRKSINLAVDDRVSVRYTAVGQSDNTFEFRIIDPEGSIMFRSRTGTDGHNFICSEAGEYELYFINEDPNRDISVTLNYEIQHYIFGMPQMLFMTMIIVAVCLGAVAVFTLMGKPH